MRSVGAGRLEGDLSACLARVLERASSVVVGKPEVLRMALACILARGHLLIEDVPGVGKTTLAQTLARHLRIPGIVLLLGADKGQVLDACNIVRVGQVQITAGMRFLVQLAQRALQEHQLDQVLVFGFGTRAPVDGFGPRMCCNLVDPGLQGFEFAFHGVGIIRRIQMKSLPQRR